MLQISIQRPREYNVFTVFLIILLWNDLQSWTWHMTGDYKDSSNSLVLHIGFAIDWYIKVTNPRLVTMADHVLNISSQNQLTELDIIN